MHYLGLRHKHERSKEHKQHSANKLSSSKKNYIHFLDKITFIIGIIGPFTVLPQIFEIFVQHTAAGVSALSWALMFLVTLPWIFYGIAHKDKPIIISFILWEIVNIIVVIGALIY